MKQSRYKCIECGRGFLAMANENTKFCKQKCMKECYGENWKPGMFMKRTKPFTLKEKLAFVTDMNFSK